MTLMAAKGEISPMPDCAIFADTQWEPAAVYKQLFWLVMQQLPFPVYIVSAGNIREDLLVRRSARTKQRFVTVPAYLRNGDQDGIGRRECTSHYKVEPINKRLREMLGYEPRQRIPADAVELWVGISVDEVIRATLSRTSWQVKRFPLLEARMNRGDCVAWLTRHGYPVPAKSACIGCPFHNDREWRDIKSRPKEWQQAVEVDESIRSAGESQQYLHSSRKPLKDVDLSTLEDHGQINMFITECEGNCGL